MRTIYIFALSIAFLTFGMSVSRANDITNRIFNSSRYTPAQLEKKLQQFEHSQQESTLLMDDARHLKASTTGGLSSDMQVKKWVGYVLPLLLNIDASKLGRYFNEKRFFAGSAWQQFVHELTKSHVFLNAFQIKGVTRSEYPQSLTVKAIKKGAIWRIDGPVNILFQNKQQAFKKPYHLTMLVKKADQLSLKKFQIAAFSLNRKHS